MATVTVTSTGNYVIHVNSSGTSTGGGQLTVQDGGGDFMLRVLDTGLARIYGTVIQDATLGIRVKNTSASATVTARFTRGASHTTQLDIQPDGRTATHQGELVLRVGEPATWITGHAEGDVDWFQAAGGGAWYLRVYWDGAWSTLSTTAC